MKPEPLSWRTAWMGLAMLIDVIVDSNVNHICIIGVNHNSYCYGNYIMIMWVVVVLLFVTLSDEWRRWLLYNCAGNRGSDGGDGAPSALGMVKAVTM